MNKKKVNITVKVDKFNLDGKKEVNSLILEFQDNLFQEFSMVNLRQLKIEILFLSIDNLII